MVWASTASWQPVLCSLLSAGRLQRHAAGFSPVRGLNALAASISRWIRWRVRDPVTGFTVQIALSASNTSSVVSPGASYREFGEAEGPHPITAFAHYSIKPPPSASTPACRDLTWFELIAALTCPFRLPTYHHGCCARDGQLFQIGLFWTSHRHGILWKGEPRQLTRFSPEPADVSAIFGEVRRR